MEKVRYMISDAAAAVDVETHKRQYKTVFEDKGAQGEGVSASRNP